LWPGLAFKRRDLSADYRKAYVENGTSVIRVSLLQITDVWMQQTTESISLLCSQPKRSLITVKDFGLEKL
jgi:hypothetical protein